MSPALVQGTVTASPRTDGVATVVVADLDAARLAVAAVAGTAGGGRLCLLSEPGAAGSLGPEVFLAIVDLAAQEAPEAPEVAVEAVLDCGSDPGYALAALRAGATAIVIDVEPEVLARLSDIAARSGARVLAVRPPAMAGGGIAVGRSGGAKLPAEGGKITPQGAESVASPQTRV